MRIIGCDLHARQQTLAMLDTTTGEIVNTTLLHEGDGVREFYSKLPRPVRVGVEATGSMHWFLNLTGELGIECQVGHPAQIRAAEPRKQKLAGQVQDIDQFGPQGHGRGHSNSIDGTSCHVSRPKVVFFQARKRDAFSASTASSVLDRTTPGLG